jgi:hypothetical protein
VVSFDRIATDNPKIFHGGWTGVPPAKYVGGSQFVEEGGVGVDALAFKDCGGVFRERDIRGVEFYGPRSDEYRGGVHIGSPTRQSATHRTRTENSPSVRRSAVAAAVGGVHPETNAVIADVSLGLVKPVRS